MICKRPMVHRPAMQGVNNCKRCMAESIQGEVNNMKQYTLDTDPHYNVKDNKCKACGEMNTGDNTCQGSCGQCWSCNCDCPSNEPGEVRE